MKHIYNFIIEKLVINKNAKFKRAEDIYNNMERPIDIANDLYYRTPSEEKKYFNKMEEYYKENIDPKKIINISKSKGGLLKNWEISIKLDWKEAFIILKNEIINKGYYDEDQLRSYIKQILIERTNNEKEKEKYEKYLDL